MSPDTAETLQSALDDLTRRVAAFEKAQKEAVEPPMLTEQQMYSLNEGTASPCTYVVAARRLRWCEAELARLREGLKVQEGDVSDTCIDSWCPLPHGRPTNPSITPSMAREIQRHRALVGGGK